MESGIIKSGKTKNGVQIYKNKETNKYFIKDRKYSTIFKMFCVFLYYKGLSYRKIEEIMGASYVVIYNWVNKYSSEFVKHFNLSDVTQVSDLEIDELYTFFEKKKIKFML